MPGGAEFGGAIFIAQRGGVEDFAVDGAEDVAEGDFRRGTGEEVAAFFAADAFGDAFGFQFEEDLNEVICGGTSCAAASCSTRTAVSFGKCRARPRTARVA